MILQRYALLALFTVYALGCWLFFQPMLVELHGHWVRPNDLDAGYLLLAILIYLYWQFGRDAKLGRVALKSNGPRDLLAGNTANTANTAKGGTASYIRVFCSITFVLLVLVAALATVTATKSVALGLLVIAFLPLAVCVLGLSVLRRTTLGLAILSMATPIWFVLVPALQALTATAVNWLLLRGRWPVYVEDNLIFLPQGALEIAAGCAGLKFVQTALTLVLVEAFLARRSFRAMALIGALAFLLAMLCNWLRVAAITLLALYLDLQHPWVIDHNWVGWVLFVLLFIPFFYGVGRLFPETGETASYVTPVKTSRALTAVTISLGLAFGSTWLINASAGGEASIAVGNAQLEIARSYCVSSSEAAHHPAPAQFAGAALTLDCALGDQRYLSLRGFLIEQQESEVISPANMLVPGLGQLDFAVANAWSEAKSAIDAAEAGNSPGQSDASLGLYQNSRVSLAYGYYAAQRWTPEPATFKLRSLARPLYSGPVWAMVIIGPPGDRELTEVARVFDVIAAGFAGALNAPVTPGFSKAPVPASP